MISLRNTYFLLFDWLINLLMNLVLFSIRTFIFKQKMFTILVLAHKCASCLVVPMDITNYESHAKCLQQVVDQHGKVGTKPQSELIENSQIFIIVER